MQFPKASSLKRFTYIALLFVLAIPLPGGAQHLRDSLASRADSLHRAWRFSEAEACYRQACEASRADTLLTADEDSLFRMRIGLRQVLSRNGAAMAGFVSRPKVIARGRYGRDEFHLYYPLPDSSWKQKPCLPDLSAASPLAPAVLKPGTEGLPYCYTAPDSTGHQRIFLVRLDENGQPGPVEMPVTGLPEDCDVAFPVLSPDGTEIRFSAVGLPGVGGYDLYSVRWNLRKRGWDAPVNMGFPYSSPGDDFLYLSSPDGSYSAFASNRACPGTDSLDVYILEYEASPVYSAVTSAE